MLKGIILGVKLDTVNLDDFNYELEELKNLSLSCDIEIIDQVTQNLETFNPLTYIGKGKIDELKMILEATDADVVVVNDELTPKQISNLDKALEALIYDRTYLILEIFKQRAKTKEAIYQVELASISYMYPRLAGLRSGLSRQRGKGGGFSHGRGAGETKLELDRRISAQRKQQLKEELKELALKRKEQRRKRNKSNIKTVALVGYTNAGKSSTINAILQSCNSKQEKNLFEKDMLFATLETQTRLVNSKYGDFLLTDTVGFIDKLPHDLVEAFKSTLEEIKECDLILHVVDASNPRFNEQIQVTNEVLKELDASKIPMVYCFNKIDKIDGYFYIADEYVNTNNHAIRISAKDNIHIDELQKLIVDEAYRDYHRVEFEFPFEEEYIMYRLKQEAVYTNITYNDTSINCLALVNDNTLNKYLEYQKNK